MGRDVCLRLHAALLRSEAASRRKGSRLKPAPDGVGVAAAIQLQGRDVLIPPAGQPTDWQAIRGGAGPGPQVLTSEDGTLWQIIAAMQTGMTFQRKGTANAVLAILQEHVLAGAERGAVLNLLELSYERRYPVVFVAKRSWGKTAQGSILESAKLPRIVVDGNDPVAVYRVCQESLRRAREGTGSTLVECRIEKGHNDRKFMESLLAKYGLWPPSTK